MAAPVLGLRRHRLVRLTAPGWAAALARPWDAQARDCLAHWATHDLPLVVTAQRRTGSVAEVGVSLGLAAPAQWGRRRLALQLPGLSIASFDEFPDAQQITALVPMASRVRWQALLQALADLGAAAHVYGSYGWQHLTGLAYVRESSDLDLWVAVADADQADAVAACLLAFVGPKLDGECVFGSGEAVSWREWAAWRAGRTRSLLVRRLDGAALSHAFAAAAGAAA